MASQYARRTRLTMIESCPNTDAASYDLDMAQLPSLPMLSPIRGDASLASLLTRVGFQ